MKFKEILMEGGNIPFEVDGQTIQGGRIAKEDIAPTMEYIAKISGIDYKALMDGALGSVGKQASSGDIDVAIDENDADFEEFGDNLKVTYDWVKINPGLRTVNILVPIQGKASKKLGDEYNGYVQVDFFFGKKAWLKFTYFSAGSKSKFAGKYRTELIGAVLAARTKFADYDAQGELIAKVGEIFDMNKGVLTQYRMRPMKKSGIGFVKSMKRVDPTDPEWRKRYGDVEAEIHEIDTPEEAAAFIFGPGTKPKDLDSFEQVKKLVEKLPKADQLLVRKLFAMRAGYTIDEVPEV